MNQNQWVEYFKQIHNRLPKPEEYKEALLRGEFDVVDNSHENLNGKTQKYGTITKISVIVLIASIFLFGFWTYSKWSVKNSDNGWKQIKKISPSEVDEGEERVIPKEMVGTWQGLAQGFYSKVTYQEDGEVQLDGGKTLWVDEMEEVSEGLYRFVGIEESPIPVFGLGGAGFRSEVGVKVDGNHLTFILWTGPEDTEFDSQTYQYLELGTFVKVQDEDDDNLEDYEEILENTIDTLRNKTAHDDVNPEIQTESEIYYSLYDFDNNGVKELVIAGAIYGDAYSGAYEPGVFFGRTIYGLYTLKDGEPVISYLRPYTRQHLSPMTDGSFWHMESSSAFETHYSHLNFAKDGKLISDEAPFTISSNGGTFEYKTDNGRKLSEGDVTNKLSRYDMVDMDDLTWISMK